MTKKPFLKGTLWAAGLMAVASACSDEQPPPDGQKPAPQVELFSWWTAEGEAQALDALLNAHRARKPDVRFENIAVQNRGVDPQTELFKRLGLNAMGQPDATLVADPPELIQYDLYGVQVDFIDKGVEFASLDALYTSEGWQTHLYSFLNEEIRFGGHYLALPVGLHRENSLFYNRQMLRDHGVSESSLTSWQGFVDACEKLKAAGKTCLALTREGWVNSILYYNVAAMTLGAQKYHTLYTGKGDPNDPQLETVARNYLSLFEKGYVGGWDPAAKTFTAAWGWNHVREEGWDEAAKDVHRGQAAFYLHGDWAVGLYKSLGWTQTELGVMAAPGTRALFIYGADGFLVPAKSDQRAAVEEVLRTWGSPATLAAFNKAKGSTPPRPDVDLSGDPLAAAVATDLKQATFTMRVPQVGDPGEVLIEAAAGTKTLDELVAAIRASFAPM
jgi:glucose/mannose transport system substrate-binding protein